MKGRVRSRTVSDNRRGSMMERNCLETAERGYK